MYSYSICPVQVRRHCQVVVFGSGRAGGGSLPERAHLHNLNQIQLTMMMMVTMLMTNMMVMMVIMMYIMVLSAFHPARVLVPNLNQIPAALHPTRSTGSNFQFLTLDRTSSVSPAKRSSFSRSQQLSGNLSLDPTTPLLILSSRNQSNLLSDTVLWYPPKHTQCSQDLYNPKRLSRNPVVPSLLTKLVSSLCQTIVQLHCHFAALVLGVPWHASLIVWRQMPTYFPTKFLHGMVNLLCDLVKAQLHHNFYTG